VCQNFSRLGAIWEKHRLLVWKIVLGTLLLKRGVDHPPPASAEVKEKAGLYLYSPFGAFVVCSKVNLTLLLNHGYKTTVEEAHTSMVKRTCHRK